MGLEQQALFQGGNSIPHFHEFQYIQLGQPQRHGRFHVVDLNEGGTGDFTYKGQNYHYYGAGHLMGTHRMGNDPTSSVVDASQRSHDVPNLWIVGSGSFPTACTANPTLTLMGLAFKSARSILAALAS